jgi:hypothetical protein
MMRTGLSRLVLCVPLIAAACAGPRDIQMTLTAPSAPEAHGFRDHAPARMLLVIFAILAIASLSACMFKTEASWSDELSERDSKSLAGTLAGLVTARIAPGEKPILLVPAANSDGKHLTAELKSLLESRGYALADGEQKLKDAHRLRYLVTAYTGGYVLRVTLGGAEASTMLSRGSDGQLIASAPLAVREVIE